MNINQPLQYILKLCLLITILNSLSVNVLASELETFGQSGRHGIDGRPGRDGNPGSDYRIHASQQPQTINISGTDGEAGESASSGEHASGCEQPKRRAVNVCGAKGGNGGDGGKGGDGGNGGNVIIYFDSASQLKNVVLRNGGGRAAPGGNGGRAGNGCNCTQPRWIINYCTWALMAQPINVTPPRQTNNNRQQTNVTPPPWTEVQRKLFRCSGDALYDEQQNRPQPPNSDENYRYGWKYIGLSRRNTFTCEDGQSGRRGRKGADGQPGNYGQVWLVQGRTIPKEQINYSDRVSLLVDKNIPLLKNNWLERAGLRSLIGTGSDVQDTFNLLQTVQGSFKVAWQAAKRPQDLGDPELRASIAASGELDFDIPGTLEYKLTNKQNQTVVAITGGIHPKRLGSFKFKGLDRFRDARNFALVDEGTLLNELKALKITISLYQDNSKKSEISYPLTPKPPYPEGLSVWGNLYKVNLGDRFDAWLQPGEPIQYQIEIEQTTRSGTTYTSGMKINLIVDKVTTSPKVEYY
jgi:hypothetical protein